MKTKNKGDILAERIEGVASLCSTGPVRDMLREYLADYLKPWTLGRSVNGHTLGDGQEWHRNDWIEDMLPDGWRPLLFGEHEHAEDWFLLGSEWHRNPCRGGAKLSDNFRRTRRPLPSVAKPILTPDQIAAGWLEWHGGECPVWGGSKPTVMLKNGLVKNEARADAYRWSHWKTEGDIIAYLPDTYEALEKAHAEGKVIQWRDKSLVQWHEMAEHQGDIGSNPHIEYLIAPAPVMVPLGPEDVTPGSVFRSLSEQPDIVFWTIQRVLKSGVAFSKDIFTWNELMECFEISRDGGKTWRKCEKEQAK